MSIPSAERHDQSAAGYMKVVPPHQRQLSNVPVSTTSVASEPKPLSSANPLLSIDVSGPPTAVQRLAQRKRVQKKKMEGTDVVAIKFCCA